MRPASSPQARPWVVASTIHSSNARAMRVAGHHRPYEDMPLTFPPVRPTCSSRSGTLARRRVGASASRQRRASAFTPAASRGPRFNEWLTLSLELTVHALLYANPVAVIGDDEAMQIQLKPVLHSSTVDLRNQAAGCGERCPIKTYPVPDIDKLVRRLP
jgi:hypothetical protein